MTMRNEEESIRIHKFLSEQGICSRRDAEEMIKEGLVEVNGKVAEIGQKIISSKDHISVQGKTLAARLRKNLTLALNKPRGLICSNHDPYHNQTVFDLLPKELYKERLFCAGRLDKESEGLLILTNDGALAHRLTHPSALVIKRYEVTLNLPFDLKKIPLLKRGLNVDGELLRVEKVMAIKKGPNHSTRLEIHLNHGRKREIRRLFEALGYRVKKLTRHQIGGLNMRGIKPGYYRLLNSKDIEKLLDDRN
jgi:23S rRNA pseudouridine2605 synthase